ncbi:hypothetical protein QWZ10_14070 [Paracoccus cavernae]|uniref:Uncharacterized protein n=1 Tax=Paracoccus cavernae TaxID=1571207 RepID=A0ABT8D7X0_9RHOB|nr:hypothetical protein [Paracoccus cavernae]
MITDPVIRNEWYPVAIAAMVEKGQERLTMLLGEDIRVFLGPNGSAVEKTDGTALAVKIAYGHVWACLGTPGELFAIPRRFRKAVVWSMSARFG